MGNLALQMIRFNRPHCAHYTKCGCRGQKTENSEKLFSFRFALQLPFYPPPAQCKLQPWQKARRLRLNFFNENAFWQQLGRNKPLEPLKLFLLFITRLHSAYCAKLNIHCAKLDIHCAKLKIHFAKLRKLIYLLLDRKLSLFSYTLPMKQKTSHNFVKRTEY